MLSDFKAFIAKGNILDLAIAVIMGAAFGAIIKTLTDGIIMPVVGQATGGIDFKSQAYDLTTKSFLSSAEFATAQTQKHPLIMYGQLINDIITFLIVALAMFFLARYAVKLFNALKASPTPPTGEEVLLTEIRDYAKVEK